MAGVELERARHAVVAELAVLVERADRLALDLIVGELILGQFRALGAQVIAADGGTELTAGDDDLQQTTVALMRRLRRKPRGGERLSYAAIPARLNAERLPTRTGRPWAGETVRGIAIRR